MNNHVRLTEFRASREHDRDQLADQVSKGQKGFSGYADFLGGGVYLDRRDQALVVSIEYWTSEEARAAAAAEMSSEIVAQAMNLMADPPTSRPLDPFSVPEWGSGSDVSSETSFLK